jgi:hypothetical protein
MRVTVERDTPTELVLVDLRPRGEPVYTSPMAMRFALSLRSS